MHGVRMDRSQPPLEHNGVRINLAVWDPQAKEPASLENPLLFYSAWSYQVMAQFSLTLPRLDHTRFLRKPIPTLPVVDHTRFLAKSTPTLPVSTLPLRTVWAGVGVWARARDTDPVGVERRGEVSRGEGSIHAYNESPVTRDSPHPSPPSGASQAVSSL